jgi:hypothetical protein
MPVHASRISSRSSGVARSAAIRAAAGSTTFLTSSKSVKPAGMPVPEDNQAKTSGSSMLHLECVFTRVPVLRLTSISPLEATTLIASRSAVLLTPNWVPREASFGRTDPGGILPWTIRDPMREATALCRLTRGRAGCEASLVSFTKQSIHMMNTSCILPWHRTRTGP